MKRLSLTILALVIACKGLQAQPRITGGFPINITDAPWQVLIRVNFGSGFVDWGGGSIIAPNFILTAKHVVVDEYTGIVLPTSNVRIYAGITCKNEINSGNTFNVSRIILHPDPNVDAALLELSSNLTYNNNIQPVNYWGANDNALYNVGNQVRASGWGWTAPNNPFSVANCLQAVNVNIISNIDASNELFHVWDRNLFAHEMATTGTGIIRQGPCHGDSGGPLTILTGANEPVLIGVVSWGETDCTGNNANSPSVYVRVSHIRDWILSYVTRITSSNLNSVVCHNGSQFTLSNLPTGAGNTVYWTLSNPSLFSLSSTSTMGTHQITVTRIGVYNGSATLWARADSTSGPIIASTDIYACEMYIWGPEFVYSCDGSTVEYYTPLISGVAHSWSSEDGYIKLLYSSGNKAYFYVPYPGYFEDYIWCTVTIGGVNYDMNKKVYISCNSPSLSSAHPNPVKDILTVEIDQTQTAQRQATAPTYDIRLYNGLGNLLRQTTTKSSSVQFNVSNLPNGTYYLYIYNGVSDTPVVHQIVVQH